MAGIKAQIGYWRRSGAYGGKPSIVMGNTVHRQLAVSAPDSITYVNSSEGLAYLAIVIGLYSRRVMGKPRSEAFSAGRCKAARPLILSRKPC